MKHFKFILVLLAAVMLGVVSCQEPITPPADDKPIETPTDTTDTPDDPVTPPTDTTDTPDEPVTPTEVSVTGIAIVSPEEETISLEVGESVTLTVAIYPEDATNKNYEVTISDPAVVWYDNQVIVGTSGGTATVTVTSEDGSFTDMLTVNVIEEEVIPDEVIVNFTKATVEVDNIYLDLTLTDDNNYNKAVFRLVPDAMDNIVGVYNSTDANMRDADSYINLYTEEGTETHSFDPGYELVITKDGDNYIIRGEGYLSGDGFFGSDMDYTLVLNYEGPIALPELEVGGEYDVDYKAQSVNVIHWVNYGDYWICIDGTEDAGNWSYQFRIVTEDLVGTFAIDSNSGKYNWQESADNGTLTITQDGDNYTLEAIVTFKSGSKERITYTGPFNITTGY